MNLIISDMVAVGLGLQTAEPHHHHPLNTSVCN
jgi:hypothetical protein